MEMAEIIVALISGGLTLIGVIFTNAMSNRRVESQLETSQAVINVKIDNLAEEVHKHNNFAARMPVVEEQIKVINHRLADLEGK